MIINNNMKWCMCTVLEGVARDGLSTCSICGGVDAYGTSKNKVLSNKKARLKERSLVFKELRAWLLHENRDEHIGSIYEFINKYEKKD